jgi:hypothetical protein
MEEDTIWNYGNLAEQSKKSFISMLLFYFKILHDAKWSHLWRWVGIYY